MRRSHGFTLIELMITIAIIAILVIIALPNYTEFVRRGKVSDAIGPLSAMRVRMEQYFQDNRSYVGACAAGTVAPLPSATTNFTYTCAPAPDATTYQVNAVGIGSMTGFRYSINQNNDHHTDSTPPGSGWPTSTSCWVLKKDGSC